MVGPLAGFDFSLEFSEALATRLLDVIFTQVAVPTNFTYLDQGQPGLLSTRQTVGGKFTFENYLIEVETGYEFALRNPVVRFQAGASQLIEITMVFALKFPRNLVTRIYDTTNTDTPLSDDPGSVKQNVDYLEDYRTAPANDPYPGHASPAHTGTITLTFAIEQKRFADGHRASAATAGVTRDAIVNVTLDDAFDPRLKSFIEVVAGKALTELIRREVDDYDMTPLFGDLSAYGLHVRDPIVPRLGTTSTQRVLAVACNEAATVGNGDPNGLSFFAESSDFAVSFREAMFAQVIIALYQTGTIPARYRLDGTVDPHGPVFLEQPRISFVAGGLMLTFRLEITLSASETIVVNAQAVIIFEPHGVGELHVNVASLKIDVEVQGLGLLSIVNTLSFNLLGAFVGDILASILQAPISNSLDAGLQIFLQSGRLAFSFQAPIRGTANYVQVLPTNFDFQPGLCTLRAGFNIV